jgi:hypothetical protein
MKLTFTRARRGLVCLPFFLVVAGCQRDDATPKATVTGNVQLYDEYGNALADNSGVTVSLYEDEANSTVTATNGSFTLPEVDLANPPRLKMEKATFGTYYTKKLTTTTSTYALPKTVRLGKRSDAQYEVSYAINKTGRYLVVKGVRLDAGGATKLLAHRIFFNFNIIDDSPLLFTSRYSKGFRNNLPTGFSDTLRFEMLAAGGLTNNVDIAVATDNLAADSCAMPLRVFNPFANSFSPTAFYNTYPAYNSQYTVRTNIYLGTL